MAWQNLNICHSVTDTFTTTFTKLSSFTAGEVIILNLGSFPLRVWDVNSLQTPSISSLACFTIPPSADMTFRGLTNSDQVSAAFLSGTGLVSYRTQYFSSNPLNTY